MAKTVLVMFPMQAGKELLDLLDKTDFDARVAAWIYNREDDEWRLALASPFIERCGEGSGYQLLQTLLPRLPRHEEALREIRLGDIDLYAFRSHFIREFRRRVHVEREDSPQLMRLFSIEGVPVDEAYVYRSI